MLNFFTKFRTFPDTDSQCDKILKLLLDNPNGVWLSDIKRLYIANHTTRIYQLRKRGHNIKNTIKRVKDKKTNKIKVKSHYILIND